VALTDRLVLAPDAVLVPLAALGAEEQRALGGAPGSWVLSHPGRRVHARLLDADAAALLAELRSPRTVAEAVTAYGRARGADPAGVLEAAFPLLDGLHQAGFLVSAGEAVPLSPSLAPGTAVGEWEVRANLRVLDDSEVYRLGRSGQAGAAALKIERPEPGRAARPAPLAWEAAVLARLTGSGAPRLLASRVLDGRRCLILEWCAGVDASTAAQTAREEAGRPGLLALGRAVAAAYADLHARGVIHGDVHPHNLLIGADGRVRLLDFGAAVLTAGAPPDLVYPGRTGVALFWEPELALAQLAGAPEPLPSAAGEQHAVAALLYLLLAGNHWCEVRLGRADLLRQLVTAPPLPFAARGLEPWPAVEEVLARALAKDPADRFPSLAAFAGALAAIPDPERGGRSARPGPLPAAAARLAGVLDRVLGRTAAGPGPDDLRALGPAVHSGAAGVACGLYRIALAREDPELLAAADLWAVHAGGGGWHEPADPLSLYHGPPGLAAVQALIAQARGDDAGLAAARDRFSELSARAVASGAGIDLALGPAGLLLAAAQLLPLTPPGVSALPAARIDSLLANLWAAADALPEVADRAARAGRPNLGMAHGQAGLLYATLRWCRAAGTPRPAGLERRLAALAAAAQPSGRGLAWPWLGADGDVAVEAMPGWCNGSAGMVHLFTLAAEELGDPCWRRLAEGAAWNAWEDPAGGGDLCCGLAGRAYALLALARAGAGREWFARACALAGRAADEIADTAPLSLFKGEVGVAALAADLHRPEDAAQPLFGEEGW
jgi:hypothetical protein